MQHLCKKPRNIEITWLEDLIHHHFHALDVFCRPLLQPNAKPTVTWEDQQNINKFSNAFQRQGELEALIQQQKV